MHQFFIMFMRRQRFLPVDAAARAPVPGAVRGSGIENCFSFYYFFLFLCPFLIFFSVVLFKFIPVLQLFTYQKIFL